MKEKKNVKDLGELPVWFYNISLDLFLRTCNAIGWSFQFKVCTGNCPLGSETFPLIDTQQIKFYNQLLVDAFLIQFWFEKLEVKSCTITIISFFYLCRGQESQPSICCIYIFQLTRRPFKLLHLQQHPLHFQRGLFLVCHIIFLVLKYCCIHSWVGWYPNITQAIIFFFFFFK